MVVAFACVCGEKEKPGGHMASIIMKGGGREGMLSITVFNFAQFPLFFFGFMFYL